MGSLVIYNTINRKKEVFEPLNPGFVGIYVCGPTVYGDAHLGHAKSYISFDLVVRYFRYLGYKVRYVQNITDVGHLVSDADEGEDKINKQARLEQLEPMEIAERYTRSYFEDMDALNLLRPDISPRASGHIPEQIDMIETLFEKGFAYEKNGNVYFDVQKFAGYGKLSGRKVDELIAGARVDVNTEKKHPADFALWKKAEPEHIMRWKSPWGVGYPGWHLECSTMSTRYLGQTFDIHGGGLENMFPHHECEIAQSEAANGRMFACYWMHNNMVTRDGVKMGKSLGNSLTIKEALTMHPAMAIRLFVLTSHYRSPLDFSEEALAAAEKGYERILQTMKRLAKARTEDQSAGTDFDAKIELYEAHFREAMNDDFNSPKAIAAVFEFFKEINSWLDNNPGKVNAATVEKAVSVIDSTVGDVLGLLPDNPESGGTGDRDTLNAVMNIVLQVRNRLRKEKLFDLADEVRKRLAEIHIEIKDTPVGTEWEQK